MPTSGLVITLAEDSARRAPTLLAIERLPDIAIGQPVDGRYLPATIQADQPTTTKCIQTIESYAGVDHVAITWIGLDEPAPRPHAPSTQLESAS
ncbi:MAG: hypothetical protein QF733_01540 [Phycisphaerales bacterium]|jgi:hypothetical protein|nr:hypothetical protein [Phycisphaerales bacterium]